MRSVRRPLVWLVLAALIVAAALLRHDLGGLAFVVRATSVHGLARRLADAGAEPYATRTLAIPTRRGPLRARLYLPDRAPRRVALLVSGLHPAGIDEPRLVGLARELAHSGIATVTPDIPELSRFEISGAITDDIEQCALWLATSSGLAHDGRVALMGISFSGGLRSWRQAGRHSRRARRSSSPSAATTICRACCTTSARARIRAGHERLRPHDYGVAVMLLAIARRVVPPEQVEALRDGVRRYLSASALDQVDKPAAAREFSAPAGTRGAPAGAVGDPASLRERPRRRHAGTPPAALHRRLRHQPGALGLAIAEAVGAGLPAPRHGRQRDPRDRVASSSPTIFAATRRCACS